MLIIKITENKDDKKVDKIEISSLKLETDKAETVYKVETKAEIKCRSGNK